MLSDLRDSGSLEQYADHVVFVYREDYYNEDTELPNVLDAIVAKNRHGSTGKASVYLDRTCGRIEALEVRVTPLDY